MVRPSSNHNLKKAEIVAAALKSFAVYGFEGTTNKTIAKEGGFKSPALIYHYFPDGKTELFRACLDQFQPLQTFSQLLKTGQDELPEVHLKRLARAYLELLEDETTARIIRIVITEMPRNAELAEMLPRHMLPVMVLPMINYLGQLAASGLIEMKQPLTTVLQFFGPLFLRAFVGQLGINRYLPIPLPEYDELVDSVVDSFLQNHKYRPLTSLE